MLALTQFSDRDISPFELAHSNKQIAWTALSTNDIPRRETDSIVSTETTVQVDGGLVERDRSEAPLIRTPHKVGSIMAT